MTIRLGVVMDAPEHFNLKKDSTMAMLFAASARQWEIYYISERSLFYCEGRVSAAAYLLAVDARQKNKKECQKDWYSIVKTVTLPIEEFDIILVRKDPPFHSEYLLTTHLLDHAVNQGVLVVNHPQALRDANEKLFATFFPQCCPVSLVTRDMARAKDFLREEGDIVCKPLDGMGGESIFRLRAGDENASVVFETLTKHGARFMMAQRYIPEIKSGDKRILMIEGEPVAHALARMPAAGELRGNLAAGGHGVVQVLTERDRWIAAEVGPTLRARGIYFAGLDVIGDFLTEINVTSPTCIREIDAQTGSDIAGDLLDSLAAKL